ncbi:MAG: hypothetical protein P4M02_04480 [Clostridia bacterium]|nr:hypothetical protein [Clostridia bacterium]
MSFEHCHSSRIFIGIAVLLGIIFGVVEASLWLGGLIPSIRAIIPYATADALGIFLLTPLLAMLARTSASDSEHENCHFLAGFGKYVAVIMIAAAIFLLFVQVFVGTLLPFSLKIVFAFIGALSFWVMLVTFVASVLYIVRRR